MDINKYRNRQTRSIIGYSEPALDIDTRLEPGDFTGLKTGRMYVYYKSPSGLIGFTQPIGMRPLVMYLMNQLVNNMF